MRTVLEVSAALVEVLGSGAVPLRGGGAVGVDPLGPFQEVGGVVAERRSGPLATDGLADADELAAALFVGERPVLPEDRRAGVGARGEVAGPARPPTGRRESSSPLRLSRRPGRRRCWPGSPAPSARKALATNTTAPSIHRVAGRRRTSAIAPGWGRAPRRRTRPAGSRPWCGRRTRSAVATRSAIDRPGQAGTAAVPRCSPGQSIRRSSARHRRATRSPGCCAPRRVRPVWGLRCRRRETCPAHRPRGRRVRTCSLPRRSETVDNRHGSTPNGIRH